MFSPFVLLVLVVCSFVAAVLRARCCAPAHGKCEAGAVCAGSVVAAQACEGELRLVSVYHDEDCVRFVSVMVVVVSAVFDVGVHDAGASVAAIVRAGNMVPSVCAAAATLIGFQGKNVAVVECEGCGECVAVTVHVGEGDAGDVAAA